METLSNNWMNQTRNRILQLLWDQWCLLGVAGNRFQDNAKHSFCTILDPEALMLATFVIARRDPRLFDEALDWSSKNGRWLSVQRMKNLCSEWEGEFIESALAAFSSWMSEIDRKGRWKRPYSIPASVNHNKGTRSETVLFIDDIGQPLPLLSDIDPHYQSNNLLRPPVQTRGMTKDVPMMTPENLLLRMRSLFGLSPRAEIVTVLTARESETLTGLAHASGYSRATLSAVIADFMASGELVEEIRSGRKIWRMKRDSLLDSWRKDIMTETPFIWFRWLPVYHALHLIDNEMMRMMKAQMPVPAVNAALCVLSDRLAAALSDVGFPSPFHDTLAYEDATMSFQDRLERLFTMLSGS